LATAKRELKKVQRDLRELEKFATASPAPVAAVPSAIGSGTAPTVMFCEHGEGTCPCIEGYCYLALFEEAKWQRMASKFGPHPTLGAITRMFMAGTKGHFAATQGGGIIHITGPFSKRAEAVGTVVFTKFNAVAALYSEGLCPAGTDPRSLKVGGRYVDAGGGAPVKNTRRNPFAPKVPRCADCNRACAENGDAFRWRWDGVPYHSARLCVSCKATRDQVSGWTPINGYEDDDCCVLGLYDPPPAVPATPALAAPDPVLLRVIAPVAAQRAIFVPPAKYVGKVVVNLPGVPARTPATTASALDAKARPFAPRAVHAPAAARKVALRSIADCVAESAFRNQSQPSREDGGLRGVRAWVTAELRLARKDELRAGYAVLRKAKRDAGECFRLTKQSSLEEQIQAKRAHNKRIRKEQLSAPKLLVVGWRNRHMLAPAIAGLSPEVRLTWAQRVAATRPGTSVSPKTRGKQNPSMDPVIHEAPEEAHLSNKKRMASANRLIASGDKFAAGSIQHALALTQERNAQREFAFAEVEVCRKWAEAGLRDIAREEGKEESLRLFSQVPTSIKDAVKLTLARNRASPVVRTGAVKAFVDQELRIFKSLATRLFKEAPAKTRAKAKDATKSFVLHRGNSVVIGRRSVKADRFQQVRSDKVFKAGRNKVSARHKVPATASK